MEKYINRARILSIESKYIDASDMLIKAASILDERNDRYYKIMQYYAKFLALHGYYFSNEKYLVKAIETHKNNIKYFEKNYNIENINSAKFILANTLNTLSVIRFDGKLQNEATEILKNLAEGCEMRAPNSECFKYISTYSSIFSSRRSRNTTSKTGAKKYSERLKISLELAKEALRHSKTVDQEASISAETKYHYIQIEYANYTNNESLKNKGVASLKDKFKLLHEEFLKGKYQSALNDIINSAYIYFDYWDIGELKAVAGVYKNRIDGYDNMNRDIADQFSNYASFIQKIWRSEKINHEMLEESISYFEKSFEYEWKAKPMGMNQINFGISLSNYGHVMRNEEILKRAVMTLKMAKINLAPSLGDQRLAIDNLTVVLNRLMSLESDKCYEKLSVVIAKEAKAMKEAYDTGIVLFDFFDGYEKYQYFVDHVDFENQDNMSDDIRKKLDMLLRQIERTEQLPEYSRSTDQAFNACFPNIPDLPGLQKVTKDNETETVI
ncbi:hypothetical protein AB835_10835 [Candidatus Endobugula sertula]|uniref:Uncharacterized protein n=1 Tax=Candidatus Endobugula sertula TaxID=62101 RepID=A0A1D2QN80_9GAMM|nr:hypothetical protein AB835_10835 [Candidatus Endobugula sertula]